MKLINNIDKLGIFGLFALAASALGFNGFELFGSWTIWVFQAMVFVVIGGLFISHYKHRCMYPLLTAIPGGLLFFYGYYFGDSDNMSYFLCTGMFGLLAGTIWNYQRNKLHGNCCGSHNI
ncbi:MAG: MerC family mercury resistance protein [Flavobacterium sp.]